MDGIAGMYTWTKMPSVDIQNRGAGPLDYRDTLVYCFLLGILKPLLASLTRSKDGGKGSRLVADGQRIYI